MNEMKKLLLTTLMVLFSTKVFAEGYYFDPFADNSFSIKDKKIAVGIYDEAKGGCWTNLGEVKRYAEDKLMLKGAVIADDIDDARLVLDIYVKTISVEEYPENCIGQIEIVLLKGIKSNGYRWVGTMAKSGGLFVQQKPTNVMVLEAVNDHIAEYK